MKRKPFLADWLRRVLEASARHRYYPLVVALIAFISTATFTFPFAAVLVPAVLIAPRRWLTLGLLCGISSGLGGGVLVEAFQFMGRELVIARFPELVHGEAWKQASEWLHQYGLFALAIIAGSPMPQTPAILLYSFAEPSTPGLILAIGIGKTVKYVFLSWLTVRYPSRFIKYRLDSSEDRAAGQ